MKTLLLVWVPLFCCCLVPEEKLESIVRSHPSLYSRWDWRWGRHSRWVWTKSLSVLRMRARDKPTSNSLRGQSLYKIELPGLTCKLTILFPNLVPLSYTNHTQCAVDCFFSDITDAPDFFPAALLIVGSTSLFITWHNWSVHFSDPTFLTHVLFVYLSSVSETTHTTVWMLLAGKFVHSPCYDKREWGAHMLIL